jgi:hypothetical protein
MSLSRAVAARSDRIHLSVELPIQSVGVSEAGHVRINSDDME